MIGIMAIALTLQKKSQSTLRNTIAKDVEKETQSSLLFTSQSTKRKNGLITTIRVATKRSIEIKSGSEN